MLAEIMVGARPGLTLSEHLAGDGEAMLRHACAMGLEGIIAKRVDAPSNAPKRRRSPSPALTLTGEQASAPSESRPCGMGSCPGRMGRVRPVRSDLARAAAHPGRGRPCRGRRRVPRLDASRRATSSSVQGLARGLSWGLLG
jgi:hypothetical protein